MNRGSLVYEGKAKNLYSIPGEPDLIWMEFKDDLTGFNGLKKGGFEGKGALNLSISEVIFAKLKEAGVESHLVKKMSSNEWVTTKLQIIPLEVIVRNKLAGSTAKKFNFTEGTPLEKPLVEFFYKNDALNDPFLSDDQALMLKAAKSQDELEQLKTKALQINQILKQLFLKAKLELIDFKIEFGRRADQSICLADEISPDSCRLWDIKTQEKFDKDRFRRDLGGIEEAYAQVLERLKSKE